MELYPVVHSHPKGDFEAVSELNKKVLREFPGSPWLGRHTPTAGDIGSIPDRELGSLCLVVHQKKRQRIEIDLDYLPWVQEERKATQ